MSSLGFRHHFTSTDKSKCARETAVAESQAYFIEEVDPEIQARCAQQVAEAARAYNEELRRLKGLSNVAKAGGSSGLPMLRSLNSAIQNSKQGAANEQRTEVSVAETEAYFKEEVDSDVQARCAKQVAEAARAYNEELERLKGLGKDAKVSDSPSPPRLQRHDSAADLGGVDGE
jgi:predicted flap endonuclease-1-like 5' DNA nuclease